MLQRDATTLEVTELPIRKWTQDYKEFLEMLIKPEDKQGLALLEVIAVQEKTLIAAHCISTHTHLQTMLLSNMAEGMKLVSPGTLNMQVKALTMLQ